MTITGNDFVNAHYAIMAFVGQGWTQILELAALVFLSLQVWAWWVGWTALRALLAGDKATGPIGPALPPNHYLVNGHLCRSKHDQDGNIVGYAVLPPEAPAGPTGAPRIARGGK